MPGFLVRLVVLALVSSLLCLLIWAGRRFVEMRRQQALAAEPLEVQSAGYEDNSVQPMSTSLANESSESIGSSVRILAFSSADCHQCHQLQAPALKRVQEAIGETVTVVEVDAPSSPELVQRYHVLTVPSTVILDASGHARIVNYGFANTRRLLQQVDEVLAKPVKA
jgi:thioredoxin-like negative regulator of GroEL